MARRALEPRPSTRRGALGDGKSCKAVVIARVAIVVVGLGYAWFAADVRTFTHPAEVLTGLPILVVAALLVRDRRSGSDTSGRPARWLAGWAALAVVLFAWEMHELFSKPRHDYPTTSSIGDAVLRTSRVTHAAAFAIWLAIGAFLTRRAWSNSVS